MANAQAAGGLSVLTQADVDALIAAVQANDLEAAQAVIERNKDVVNKAGPASAKGNIRMAGLLLGFGADVNAVDQEDTTPLYSAIKFNKKNLIKFLLENGASIEQKNSGGYTVLHILAKKGDVEILELLLRNAPSKHVVNIKDDQGGCTPLFSAMKYGKGAVVDYLVRLKDIDLFHRSKSGHTAFHVCAASEAPNAVKTFRKALKAFEAVGGDPKVLVDIRDKDGQTPIFSALKYKQMAMVTFLVKDAHCNLNIQDKFGKSPLHWVARSGLYEMAKLCLEHGANPLMKSVEGRLASHEATPKLKKLLQEKEAEWQKRIDQDEDDEAASIALASSEEERGSAAMKKRKDTAFLAQPDSKKIRSDEFMAMTAPLKDGTQPLADSSENFQPAPVLTAPVPISPLVAYWKIEYSSLGLGELLGKGSFGEVRKAQWQGVDVAVKMLHDQEAALEFFKEVEMMCKLRHPNIVHYFGASLPPQPICIVMEFLPSHLGELIRIQKRIPYGLLLNIGRGTAQGVKYLHIVANIIHRDLKPANILLDPHYVPKIADFGVSRDAEASKTMTGIGTPIYMAPEMLSSKNYTKKVDIFSLGLVLWQMYTGQKPYTELQLTPIQIAYKVAVEHIRPLIPADMPSGLANLITSSWHHNPDERPSIDLFLDTVNQLLASYSHTATTQRSSVTPVPSSLSPQGVNPHFATTMADKLPLGQATPPLPDQDEEPERNLDIATLIAPGPF